MAKGDFPRIPDAEFVERISNVKAGMEEQRLDLLVVYSNALDPGHVRYLSDVFGMNESAAMVIPAKGEPSRRAAQLHQGARGRAFGAMTNDKMTE